MSDYVQRETRNGVACVILTEGQYQTLLALAEEARQRHSSFSHSTDREARQCPRCVARAKAVQVKGRTL